MGLARHDVFYKLNDLNGLEKTRVGLRVWEISVTDRRCDSTLTEFVFVFGSIVCSCSMFLKRANYSSRFSCRLLLF